MKKYANIIIDISHEKLDRTFQYKIADSGMDNLEIGMPVEIPFGMGNTLRKGYVLELTDREEFDPHKMKYIIRIIEEENRIETKLIQLAGFLRKQYGCTMIQALKTVIPVKDKMGVRQKKSVRLIISGEELEKNLLLFKKKHFVAKVRLLEALAGQKSLDYDIVTKKLHISSSTIQSLLKDSLIYIDSEAIYRNPVKQKETEIYSLCLNEEQKRAAEGVLGQYKNGILGVYLLHGVTGSGKTEVYMELIAAAIEMKKQSIVLIPEIALTYQTVMRFYERFGDRVSIMNSKLSKGERHDQFLRAQKGMIDVMVGPRSALFTPFPDLGFIIIDEEHENSYKSETVPRYHAREVAIYRAEQENASVVLGSATPAVESYFRALQGEYTLYCLQRRAKESSMPEVEIIDLRAEMKEGNRSIFSNRLRWLMEDRIRKGEQIILFLNRRGYAGFVSCRSCGKAIQCPHCDISLSVHNNGMLMCHYCGYEETFSKSCPSCGSNYIGTFRVGTQQIEELVKKEFTGAKVLRMDLDTTRRKGQHEEILSAFANGEANILIGTQMIVKGHDFPNVTLVGILAADMSLFSGDYRAGERTYQLLTQAVGRAGRGEKAGEAVIQTYQPDHYSIQTACRQNYEEFYEKEMIYRKLGGYPPVKNLLAILVSSADEKRAREVAIHLKQFIVERDSGQNFQIIGPAEGMIAKVNDIYKMVLYLKEEKGTKLNHIIEKLEEYIETEGEALKDCTVQFDRNPMNMH